MHTLTEFTNMLKCSNLTIAQDKLASLTNTHAGISLARFCHQSLTIAKIIQIYQISSTHLMHVYIKYDNNHNYTCMWKISEENRLIYTNINWNHRTRKGNKVAWVVYQHLPQSLGQGLARTCRNFRLWNKWSSCKVKPRTWSRQHQNQQEIT